MPHLIHRDGQYFGPQGWMPVSARAIKFASKPDAEAGLADFRRQFPQMFKGAVEIVSRPADETIIRGPLHQSRVDYDPFGVRS